ncbi:MAG: uncharacterized protein K0R24_1488 [Gammaproteobacteria bacterium]|jgi:peptidoglycan/xylan/chitin deacetylase (PgdA/CDA1 family)|nr:uncharacterized protein [Gammaproteobacteria bacterium]
MSYFAIRDDDTSFFTKPEGLEEVYSPYWGIVPISLAVVPFSVPEHRGHRFSPLYDAEDEVPLGENNLLVNWLKPKINKGDIEIMLHGYNHRYQQYNNKWVGEFGWKPKLQLIQEVAEGKTYLETLLETKIRVFVPPSNTIGTAGIYAIRRHGLHLSGVMGRGGDRPFSVDYLLAYFKRWAWRLYYKEPYPYPLSYGGHTELIAHALTPSSNINNLIFSLERCAKLNTSFVLATHYWEFSENPRMHKIMEKLINRACKLNMTFVTVSKCFEKIP